MLTNSEKIQSVSEAGKISTDKARFCCLVEFTETNYAVTVSLLHQCFATTMLLAAPRRKVLLSKFARSKADLENGL